MRFNQLKYKVGIQLLGVGSVLGEHLLVTVAPLPALREVRQVAAAAGGHWRPLPVLVIGQRICCFLVFNMPELKNSLCLIIGMIRLLMLGYYGLL